jgi:ABC-type multidrug transport system ATPase subunit
MNAQPLFAADSIGKSFGGRAVLKSASVWAWSGRITVLLGRNGSGKSTLMRIGAGVMRADHGAIRFDGRTYLSPRLYSLARDGLYLLADRGSIPLNGTLRTFLRLVVQRYDGPSADAAAAAVGMENRLDMPVMELSGGEMKRAEVALAIARAPRCLLADEPFAGISPLDAECILNALRTLRGHGCAIVVSGHEVPSMLEIADEVVWVTAGTTHALGPAVQARRHHQFCREYLGVLATP